MLQFVAVRCSALQYVAVRCSPLQCVAVHYSAMQCVTVRYRVLHCVAVRCSALQCVAVRCSTLQRDLQRLEVGEGRFAHERKIKHFRTAPPIPRCRCVFLECGDGGGRGGFTHVLLQAYYIGVAGEHVGVVLQCVAVCSRVLQCAS